MEIIIKVNEEGKFSINKTDSLPIFTAIGMLELAKSIMLEDNSKPTNKELEGQVKMEEVID